MGKQRRVTQSEKDYIRTQYLAGKSGVELIEEIGCSPSNFYLIVKGLCDQRRATLLDGYKEKLNGLNPIDLGWVVGIMDGEGHIGLYSREGSNWVTPRVTVASTTKEMQLRLYQLCGGHLTHKRGAGNNRDTHVWELWSCDDVLAFLEVIRPYLIVKQKVADVVIDYCRVRAATPAKSFVKNPRKWIRQVNRLNAKGKHTEKRK